MAEKQMGIVKIRRVGNSNIISLPYRLFKEGKLEEECELDVFFDDEKDEVLIRKRK